MGSCGIKKHIKQRQREKSARDEPASQGEQVGVLEDDDASDKSDPELAITLRKEAGHAETRNVSAIPEVEGMGKDVQIQGQFERANLYATVLNLSG